MKIGFVRRGHSDTGGAEAYLLRLAGALQAMGEETVLVTTEGWPDGRWTGGEILRLPGRSPVEFAAAVRGAKTGCDVLFSLERAPGCAVHRAGDGVHAAWLRRRDAFEPVWKRAMRWMNRKHSQILELEEEVFDPANTRIVIANSQMVHDEILSRFNFPEGRVRVVYNGLEPIAGLPAKAAAREMLGIEPGVFCVLFLGSGWERKGLGLAIRAVERLDNAVLLVAGRGPVGKFPSRKAEFLGPVSNLAPVLAASDIMALPTWYDPFSNACLEALAAGMPVVTTTANGFSEIIEPGVHGDVVEPGDGDALWRALSGWQSGGRCDAFAGACRDLARGFSIERNARETLEAIRSAVEP